MGPWEGYAHELERELNEYCRAHPGVIIRKPEESKSHKWEVLFPPSGSMFFDDPEMMLRALPMTGATRAEESLYGD
jgi:hypothetical protein